MRPARPPRRFLAHPTALAFAHRGGAAQWPENTLLAFRKALDLGCPYLETDLHATRDGVLVCLHDATVDRTTDGTGPVSALTFDELRRLDAGHRFTPDGRTYPHRGAGLAVPTLEEVVALSPDARFNVEIKQRDRRVIEAFWRFIDDRGLHDRFLVAAAEHAIGRWFRALSGGAVATSASRREIIAFVAAVRLRAVPLLPLPYDALQVPVRSGPLEIVTPRLVRVAHARGLHVHVWTIDEPEEMQRLLDLGVDGLMSDRPDLLVRAVDPRGGARGAAPCAAA